MVETFQRTRLPREKKHTDNYLIELFSRSFILSFTVQQFRNAAFALRHKSTCDGRKREKRWRREGERTGGREGGGSRRRKRVRSRREKEKEDIGRYKDKMRGS